MKRYLPLIAALLLTGCAFNMTLMPRDSGKVYTGEMKGDGTGKGTAVVTLDGATCSGPVATVASNDTFGFATTYGTTNRGYSGTSFTTVGATGDKTLKAIMSCTNGRGLRCDLTGRDSSGGGVCVDDAGKVYDALITRK